MTVISLIIIAIACKKTDLITTKETKETKTEHLAARGGNDADDPEKVAYYSEYFLNDSTMAFVLENFIVSSVKARGIVQDRGGNNALEEWDALVHNYENYDQLNEFYLGIGVDTSEMIEIHANPMASWLNLLVKNPGFHDLTMNDQQLVLENLQATLTTSFEEENPENILIKTVRDLINTDPVMQARELL